jgi:hypothetical protein
MQRIGLASWLCVVLLASIFVAANSQTGMAQVGSAKLLAHWKLAGDFQDSSGNNLHATSRGVVFETDFSGPSPISAAFRGKGEFLSVPHSDLLKLGTADFSLSLWVHTEQALNDEIGDLVSKFDPVKRAGFQISVRNNTGVTTSLTNERQLQFGIDSTTEPKWTDLGRPGGESSIVPFSLAEFDGKLFAGTCEPAKNGKGDVYFLNEKREWQRIPVPHLANTVSSLAAHDGNLYAGTAKYRVAGSALAESENLNLGGQLFRLNPAQDGWIPIGQLPDTQGIGGMTAFQGQLYASSLYKPAGFFRYAGGDKWTSLPTPNGKRAVTLGVYNGYIWAGGYDEGHVYRFDGETWTDMGRVGDNTQTYSFAIHEGRLCVGTWPSGKVFRLTEQNTWEDIGRLGEELEVMAMLVHNGKLYAGTLPLADVHRYDGGQTWTKIKQVDLTPDVKFRRVWTMTQHRGQLVCGTLPSGHVHALETGASVMSGKPIRAGWRQITAVKEKSRLSLYVDGVLQGTSTDFDSAQLDLSNQEALRIGAGSGDTFQGRMSDVRLYQGALTAEEIARMQRAQ